MAENEKLDIFIRYFKKLEENRKDSIGELVRKLADIHCNKETLNSGKVPKEQIMSIHCIVLLMVVFVMVGVFMSCASTDDTIITTVGESSPLLSGTRWEYSEDGHTAYYIEFSKEGDAVWYDTKNNVVRHLSVDSKWLRNGNTIIIPHNSGYRHLEGTLMPGTIPRKITGTGISKHRAEWTFTMIEN